MSALSAWIESGTVATAIDLLADDVVLRSPVNPQPYRGRATVAAVLVKVFQVLQDFTYVREIVSADERDHALIFEATVDGHQITGCDFVHIDDTGKVDDLMVMVRPFPAARALYQAMGHLADSD